MLFRSVNMFSPTFLTWDDKDVRIWWNDLVFRNGKRFATTTFQDLKWMARKIAAIEEDEIKKALVASRMPDDVVDLYFHKLRLRRNEIVAAFKLEDEFELFAVPDLKTYSPNENIKNGEIVKTFFEGHNEFEVRRNYARTLLFESSGFTLPLFGLTDDFKFEVEIGRAHV